jgi:undecaprenyl-diphosphatase
VEYLLPFDTAILNFIHENFSCKFLDAVMPVITALGNGGIIWIIAAVVMIFFKKTRKAGFMIGASLLVGLIFGNLVLKNFFARIRPFDLEGAAVSELLIKAPTDFSFPSGHTLAAFEASAVLMKFDKRMGIPALVLAVLIAFSRLYLYVHFPSDVLAGAVLGVLFAFIGSAFVDAAYEAIEKAKQNKKASG